MRRRCKCGTSPAALRIPRRVRIGVHGGRARLYCRRCGRRVAVKRSLCLRRWLLSADR